jgi:hypothetical protein
MLAGFGLRSYNCSWMAEWMVDELSAIHTTTQDLWPPSKLGLECLGWLACADFAHARREKEKAPRLT